MTDNSLTVHIPVLLQEVQDALLEPFRDNSKSAVFVDCTFGGGGHTQAILKEFDKTPEMQNHRVIAFDRDEKAIERGRAKFSSEIKQGRLELIHSPFSALREALSPGDAVLGILADLGLSSDQIETGERGFSFLQDGPLDMRQDTGQGVSCMEYLEEITESDLADVIYELGQERFSRGIARSIKNSYSEGNPPTTTKELSQLVIRGIPSKFRHGRIHAATRTFQALRMAVNQEIQELDSLLENGILSLAKGGRFGVISFHSLEDRRVKVKFREQSKFPNRYDSEFELYCKKPIIPSEDEIQKNPRARTSKFRVLQKK